MMCSRIGMGVIILICGCTFTGCRMEKLESKKEAELDYKILEQEDIPKEMEKEIENRKNKDFLFTYSDQGKLYIAKGYGSQKMTGCRIQVDELYESENAIWLQTTLMGPEPGEKTKKKETFPYIVLQAEASEKLVRSQ